jgi:hypothetical protein
MGFLDRLFGRREEPETRTHDVPSGGGRPVSDDERALQRYRYMLRTAPPETIEQAHEEAFSKLTPAQRAQVLRELGETTPEGERAALAESRDDPKSLARLATRAEMRQPGAMERIFGGRGMGSGMGGMMAGSIFGSLVAGFVGSIIAQEFFDSVEDLGLGEDDSDQQTDDDSAADDYGDAGSDYDSSSDQGSGDYWGDDSGSDWGGGDFGGGDW